MPPEGKVVAADPVAGKPEPGAEQVSTVGEKVYSERAAHLLKMSGDLPEGAKVLKAPDVKNVGPVDVKAGDSKEADPVPGEPKPEPTPDPKPTPDPEPKPVAPVEPADPESGYKTGKVGALEYREDSDGNVEFKRLINGVEDWIKDASYIEGHQLNAANHLKAKELSDREKSMKQVSSVDTILNEFWNPAPTPGAAPAAQDPVEDFFNADPAPAAAPAAPAAPAAAATPESARMDRIEKQLAEERSLRQNSQDAQEFAARTFDVYKQSRLISEERGLTIPDIDNPQMIARVKAYADSMGVHPQSVATDPFHMLNAMKGIVQSAKPKVEDLPVEDENNPRPTAEAPRKSSPAPAALTRLETEYTDVKEAMRIGKISETEGHAAMLRLKRHIDKARDKKV